MFQFPIRAATATLFMLVAKGAVASDIMIMDAFARASLTPKAVTSAAYLSIMNHGGADDKLLAVTCACSAAATLHKTEIANDIVKMRAIEEGLIVAAGQTLRFEEADVHIMLEGLMRPLVTGDKITLRLSFEKAGVVEVSVPVGDAAPDHQHAD